jgi:hypothetical protein
LEHTSTTISLRVEREVKVLPHEVQRTVVSVSSGWMCFKEIPPSSLQAAENRHAAAHRTGPQR